MFAGLTYGSVQVGKLLTIGLGAGLVVGSEDGEGLEDGTALWDGMGV
jgi:hypothetical protein